MDHNGENHVSVRTRIRTVPACAGSGRWRRHKRSPGLFRPEMHSDYLCWFHPKSSSIQTILSASEFHRVMPCGSWAIPPVGTFTLPWRFFIKLNYFNTIQQWTEPVNKSCVRKCTPNVQKCTHIFFTEMQMSFFKNVSSSAQKNFKHAKHLHKLRHSRSLWRCQITGCVVKVPNNLLCCEGAK